LERKSALEGLVKSPGWGLLRKVAEEQVRLRERHILLKPLTGLDGVPAQEFEKGEVAGLRLLLTLPENMIAGIEYEMKEGATNDESEE